MPHEINALALGFPNFARRAKVQKQVRMPCMRPALRTPKSDLNTIPKLLPGPHPGVTRKENAPRKLESVMNAGMDENMDTCGAFEGAPALLKRASNGDGFAHTCPLLLAGQLRFRSNHGGFCKFNFDPRTGEVISEELNPSVFAHTGMCYCVSLCPTGARFATGGADASVCVWSSQDLVCRRTMGRLDWPVRAVGFSHDGVLLAAGSEDAEIDVFRAETGGPVASIPVNAPVNDLAWHPRKYLLAYACDDKDQRSGKDEGSLRVWGLNTMA
jgi:hypothetical protein